VPLHVMQLYNATLASSRAKTGEIMKALMI